MPAAALSAIVALTGDGVIAVAVGKRTFDWCRIANIYTGGNLAEIPVTSIFTQHKGYRWLFAFGNLAHFGFQSARVYQSSAIRCLSTKGPHAF